MKNRHFEEDTILVEGCIKGDMTAWACLVKKYSNLISISVENRLKKCGFALPRQETEDIRQDILASIWKDKKLQDVRNRKDISYWLAVVSGNAAMAYLRRWRAEEPRRPISIFERVGETELKELLLSPGANPKEESIRKNLSNKIEEAIKSLSTKERLIMKLNLLYSKKHEEISEMLNMPKGTVSSHVKRAKEKLREFLKDFY